ncbi:MAG: T9SS type A sorting domain-containing protein, partial [bacterium]
DTRNNYCCCPVVVTYTGDTPLPVELSTFEAIAGDRQVTLNWTTASELNNDYFEVQRNLAGNWTTLGQVDGAGTSVIARNYSYTDHAVVNGVTYTYRLLSHDINGIVHEYGATVEATPGAPTPTEYALSQNYPNPFNPQTSITYAVKEAGFVTLKVYNLMGQEVATLVSAKMSAGHYTASFAASDLPSGIYVYRLEVNDFTAQKKMVLLK